MKPKLTIGMATYRDFGGLYMTIQALRMYHVPASSQDVELLVVDQTPNNSEENKAHIEMAKGLCSSTRTRYISMESPLGTSPSRNRVIEESSGRFRMCIDSHVMFPPNTINTLLKKIENNELGEDLYTGPIMWDNGAVGATHLNKEWRGEMLGTWGCAWLCNCSQENGLKFSMVQNGDYAQSVSLRDGYTLVEQCSNCGKAIPRLGWGGHEGRLLLNGYKILGNDPTTLPFEIPAQGLGLFLVRESSWLGFVEHARGFGGEEWCIHETYRRAGRKAICLPDLPWLHNFGKPNGSGYSIYHYDKARNYVLWFTQLGLPFDDIKAEFVRPGKLRDEEWDWLLEDPIGHTTSVPVTTVATVNKPCAGCGGAPRPTLPSLEEMYQKAVSTPSDINEHCSTLKELAAKCEHITEFGVRHGVSTVALLSGHPKLMISYDLTQQAEVDTLRRVIGGVFQFRAGDSRQVSIQPTDLLFIDTKHTEEQLLTELTRHHAKVSHYIVLHDTVTFGETGEEEGSRGLLYAVRQFIQANPEWTVIKHYRNNNGLMVLSKDPSEKKALPNVVTQAWNYANAQAKFLAAGLPLVTTEQFQKRVEICTLCPLRTNGKCAECGCPIDQKAVQATGQCPHPVESQWPVLTLETEGRVV